MKELTNFGLISVAAILLSGCFPDSDSGSSIDSGSGQTLSELILDTNQVGAIAATTADYSTSDIVLFRNQADKKLIINAGDFESASEADISIDAAGNRLYRLGRYGIDNLSRYNVDQELNSDLAWQFSVQGDDSSANPYKLVEQSTSRAYLVRYDVPNLWIVNPSETDADAFKLAELDLSAYADFDCSNGTPNANDALILDNKLYVLMERLGSETPDGCNFYGAEQNSYVAVFDLQNNDAEVDISGGTLKGIELSVKNAGNLAVHNGLIYVSGRATGKIETIDPGNNYATDVLNLVGANFSSITQVEIADSNHGYFVDGSWNNYSLYHFNPSNLNQAAVVVGDLSGISIADIKAVQLSEASASYQSLLYVAVQGIDHGRIDVINVLDQSTLESFDLEFNPTEIEFLTM